MTLPTSQTQRNKSRRTAVGLTAVVFAIGVLVGISRDAPDHQKPLVVYCAHDSIFAEDVLRDFEKQTGIPLAIVYDTEATKSLGLVNLLIREKPHPRCDVFWNNQLLGTLDLKRDGVLLPYKGTGYNRIPQRFKDPAGTWTGFAARMRVYIINTEKMAATYETIDETLSGSLSRTVIAKPLYGTTRSHYTVLWKLWGPQKLKQWHRDAQSRGMHVVSGNATVKNLVAAGVCDLGWTDTDDFFVAKDNGKPVAMLPIRVSTGQTICIPNTVSIIRGSKQLAQSRQLVDFLLSEQTELKLANSRSRQIPLGPVDPTQLSDAVKALAEESQNAYDLTTLGSSSLECLTWLKSESLQ